MDQAILECKSFEYIGKIGVAMKKGDTQAERKYLQQLVFVERLLARHAVRGFVSAAQNRKQAKRGMRKAKDAGVSFPLGEKQIALLGDRASEARKTLVKHGMNLSAFLDLWQQRGASLQDLCNLCNRDYQQALEEIDPDRLDERFSALIFVYNLDYKDPSDQGWLDFDVDAPLTHAVKEYWLDLMLHTPEGKEASQKAFASCFPEIWDQRVHVYTDPDGIQRVVDKDGVEVGTVEEGWV